MLLGVRPLKRWITMVMHLVKCIAVLLLFPAIENFYCARHSPSPSFPRVSKIESFCEWCQALECSRAWLDQISLKQIVGRPTKIAYTGCSKLFSSSTWLCKKYCGALLLSHWQRPLAVQFTSPLHRVPVRERVCVYQYIISVSGVIRAVVVNWETQRVADALKRGRHASQTHWTLNLLLDVRSQCLNRCQLMINCFIIGAIHRAPQPSHEKGHIPRYSFISQFPGGNSMPCSALICRMPASTWDS